MEFDLEADYKNKANVQIVDVDAENNEEKELREYREKMFALL